MDKIHNIIYDFVFCVDFSQKYAIIKATLLLEEDRHEGFRL